MIVNVRKSTIVRPASADTPRGRMWTSSLDQIMRRTHTPILQFYSPNASSACGFFDPERLKNTLGRVLVTFYPVAGRLRTNKNGRIEIDCNAEGVLFVEAETSTTIDDLRDFAPTMEMKKLLPEVDYAAGLFSFPLLIIQLTRFQCGGVCLGFGLFHVVGDGIAVLDIINAWSAITRGLNLTVHPFFDRTLLQPRKPPKPKFHHIEYQSPPRLKFSGASSIRAVPNIKFACSVFRFTKGQIDTLKLKAKEATGSVVEYSSFEIIAGHVWKSACMARGLTYDQETKLYYPTDGRFRLQPPLPTGYLGNAIFWTSPVSLVGDLNSKSSWFATRKIHDALTRMDKEYMRSAIDYLEIQPSFTPFIHGAHSFGSPNLMVSSWTRLPVYDTNFGWGQPFFAGPGGMGVEGLCYVLPDPKNNGSMFIAIGLEDEHVMKLFAKYVHEVNAKANL